MSSPSQSHAHAALTPTALVLTSHLLRHDNPNLAFAIQHALEYLGADRPPPSTQANEELQLNTALLASLHAQTVGEILAALTVLGQQAVSTPQRHPERVALLHELLDEWVALAEWILQRTDNPPERWH
ncbi:hypothetical protein [Marinimicrobium locisalis]|uniref:hypothetical protein n=1 Tax=Marinimicrobium locisalis TaxID=546022 RepID=UPI003221C055